MQNSAQTRPRSQRAFTLIELMIALVVIGILGALAFPSFLDSIRKNRRSDAFSTLNAVQQAQERHRANKAEYAASLVLLNWPTDEVTSSGGYYKIKVTASSPTGYALLASPVSGRSQASDGLCAFLRIRAEKGDIFYGSAAGAGGPFEEASTNRCWSR